MLGQRFEKAPTLLTYTVRLSNTHSQSDKVHTHSDKEDREFCSNLKKPKTWTSDHWGDDVLRLLTSSQRIWEVDHTKDDSTQRMIWELDLRHKEWYGSLTTKGHPRVGLDLWSEKNPITPFYHWIPEPGICADFWFLESNGKKVQWDFSLITVSTLCQVVWHSADIMTEIGL